MIGDEEKQKIITELSKRINSGDYTCPMCGHKQFFFPDGYFNSILQDKLDVYEIKGQSMPSIALICNNCGFISSHALGILGMLPKPKEDKGKGGENGK